MISNMIENDVSVVPWSEAIAAEGVALLNTYQTTSMFLLSNLKECGPCLGELHYSGNFKCLLENNKLVAVFSLSKDGNLLLQTDRAKDYSSTILPACLEEGILIKGCVGAWELAEPFWQLYSSRFPDIKTTTYSKELLYNKTLNRLLHQDNAVRFLKEEDFAIWEPLNTAYFIEMDFLVPPPKEERRIAFNAKANKHYWWGLFEGDELIAIAAYNACVEKIAQIGGVYTLPKYRKKGYAKRVLQAVIADSHMVHGLESLLLFTDEDNVAARTVYEHLGFQETGNFGLIFGEKR